MIFYFTGTGNSEYLAKKIAEKTGDKLVNITEALRSESYSYTLQKGENIGFAMPVYYSGVPHAVKVFIEKAVFNLLGDNYAFCALTCGGATSNTGKMLFDLLKDKGISQGAQYGVVMVDNYIYMYDISDEDGNIRKLQKARGDIEKIALMVSNKDKNGYNPVSGPAVMTKFMYPLYEVLRRTKPFKVSENCIGCGKCERECAEKAIEIQNGKPVWVKSRCSHCLRCIHACPQRAIEMGRQTKNRNRYMNPYV